jgi:hypothetical protein
MSEHRAAYSLANVDQSADTADDEGDILIGAPRSAFNNNVKNQR